MSSRRTQNDIAPSNGIWPEGRFATGLIPDRDNYDDGSKWWQRLSARLIELNWSKADLARQSGVAYESVNKYLRGAVDKPRGDILDHLSRAVGRDAQWILFGDHGRSLPASSDAMMAKTLFPLDATVKRGNYVGWDQLPRYSELERGFKTYAGRNALLRTISCNRYFSVPVPDASMEPEFKCNELLICEVDAVCNSEDYVIVSTKLEDHVYFRKLFVTPSLPGSRIRGVLRSNNPAFPDIQIRRRNPVKILGKIVGCLEGVALMPPPAA